MSGEYCEAGGGWVGDDTDCNDSSDAAFPGATEVCDGLDNDCDSATDEDVTATFYADADGDGYGDPAVTGAYCVEPAGWVSDDNDCDDTDAAVNPNAVEVCDSVDNDCDGGTDEDLIGTFYLDSDGDTWGDDSAPVTACFAPPGYWAQGGDCDDSDPAVYPGATEQIGSGRDEDCDGSEQCYADADDDGYRTDIVTVSRDGDCSDYAEALAADNGGDCDDTDGSVYPGADEYCDGADNDCDGQVDEGAVDGQSWYTDADGDGYGDPASAILSCQQPAGATADGTDCDDGDASVNPGAAEACDGIDNDCDGAADTGAALEVGYLPAWAASYTDSSLAWSALETDSLRYGSCPLNITDTGSGFTLATLLAYDVLIISDPAGGGRQYSAGELTAISDYLTGGYGGAFSDMPGSVTTGATVVLPAHPVVANVPASFTLVSFTAEQGVTGGWSSVVPDATAGFLIQGAGGSSVIANDTGAWRTVLFTGMVDYQTPGDDARQILYDALMWSGGY